MYTSPLRARPDGWNAARRSLRGSTPCPGTVNPQQLLFGINQGGTFDDLRVKHMQEIAALDLPGYAIGGLAVGESTETMYHILDVVLPHAPEGKPRYLMGGRHAVEYY